MPVGIGDDAAVLVPAPGRFLVTSTDTLLPGRHFLPDWPPAAIGHLALAVNLSDLAAMGARPRWALLALTLSESDSGWLDAFLDGFLSLGAEHGVILVGGNLARGPLNIGVQVIGDVEPNAVPLRSAARIGDLIAVTGSLGDAAWAWRQGPDADPALLERWQRPAPRIQAGRILAPKVHAMMDISDGLLADLSKLVAASGCSARIELQRLPASQALLKSLERDEERQRIQAEGGSDYELLVTLDRKQLELLRSDLAAAGQTLTVIGEIMAGDGIEILDENEQRVEMRIDGWDHFKS